MHIVYDILPGSVKITFYGTAGGASPVEKYLVDLDSKERAAVADALKAIEISGLRAAGVRTRQIKGKLWEIKASQQRVFYVVVMGGEIVLLHAAKKEGQRADRGDLETAELRFQMVTGEEALRGQRRRHGKEEESSHQAQPRRVHRRAAREGSRVPG